MNSVLSNEYNKSYLGLIHLTNQVKNYAASLPQKLCAMEKKYLQDNPTLYDETEQKHLKYLREAFTYKYYLSILHLEQLWSIHHVGSYSPTLYETLSNLYDHHQVIEEKHLLPSFVIEGFVVQGNAFLDFYMLYIYAILKVTKRNRLNKGKFINRLGDVSHDQLKSKAEKVKEYFEENVLSKKSIQNCWGLLLNSLRDSAVHRDLLYPDFEKGESLLGQILKDVPSIKENILTIEFFQTTQNSMFYLVTELSSQIYSLEWKPGPYKPGMW